MILRPMKKKRIPRSIRKHIRKEKARIRKDAVNKEEKIKELLNKFNL